VVPVQQFPKRNLRTEDWINEQSSILGELLMAENKTQEDQNGTGYKEDRNIGAAVFILLIALTIGEFFIGYIAIDWNWPLWGIAIFKAALIIYYFMHVTKLFGVAEEETS
jgi:hypothetical protein